MQENTRKTAFKAAIFCTRYIPVLIAAIMLGHVLLLCCGIRLEIAENVLVLLLAAGALASDIAFGFCRLHRAFIVYAVAVDWCINLQRSVGFGCTLDAMHTLMAVAGGSLFTLLIVNRKTYGKRRKKKGDSARNRNAV